MSLGNPVPGAKVLLPHERGREAIENADPMEQEERIPAERVFEFLATMAHELRNPMTPILGQVQLRDWRVL